MAGNGNGKPKPVAAGWGDDEPPAHATNSKDGSPLSEEEIMGLRTVLDRHGFDRKKGTF